jgi:hypothetical protein
MAVATAPERKPAKSKRPPETAAFFVRRCARRC